MHWFPVVPMLLSGALATQSASSRVEITGGVVDYTVRNGDTLRAIASRYGVEWSTLAQDDQLDAPDRIEAGQVLRIDNRHIVPPAPFDTGILVNIPQRMLFYFSGGELVRAYPVGMGRIDWPTPTGTFDVAARDENPTWVVPEAIQEEMRQAGRPVVRTVPPGPSNPLGAFRLRLNDPAYSIHGTDAPGSIYRFESHGCVRLHPDDIADLFGQVSVGTPVRIVYEPVLLTALADGSVFLEVHRDVYGARPDPRSTAERLIRESGLSGLDPAVVAQVIDAAAGVARPVPYLRATRAEGPANSR